MTAARYDIVLDKGATFSKKFTWRDAGGSPVDLTGYTAKAQVRLDEDDATAILTFDTEAAPATIVLGGVLGTIVMSQTKATTAGLDTPSTTPLYDLELYDPTGVAIRLIDGRFHIKPNMTQ